MQKIIYLFTFGALNLKHPFFFLLLFYNYCELCALVPLHLEQDDSEECSTLFARDLQQDWVPVTNNHNQFHNSS